MNNFWRALIAGYGAKKLGGGCISTIIVFIVIYYALGTCNSHPAATTNHASIRQPAKVIPMAENTKTALPMNAVLFDFASVK